MTNGQYTLADYTNLNRVLTARITALENATAFNPNNVTIGGFLNIQSNSTNPGNLSVTNNAQVSGSLQVNKTVTVNQNLNVAGNVTVAGNINFSSVTIPTINSTDITTVNFDATTANTTTIINSGTTTSTFFSGNGAALTGVLDNTKLPTTGGTVSGNLAVNGTLTTGSDLDIFGSAGPGQSNPIVHSGDVLIVASNGTQTKSLTLTSWSNTTTGLHISPTEVLLGAGGSASYYPSASIGCSGTTVTLTGNTTTAGNITLTGTGKFVGDGSLLTTIPYSALTGTVPTWNQNTTGNAATATNVAYSGLTGAIPTWNQNTTGNAATATNVAYSGLTGTIPTWNQNTTGNAATATNVAYSGLTGAVPTWNQSTTGNALTATNVANLSGGSAGTVPYQSNTGTTLFTAVGTAGQVLTSQGSGAPIWASVSAGSPPTVIVLNGVSGSPTSYVHSNTALHVVYQLNQYGFTFYFNGGAIGQTITFTRSAFDASGIIFTYNGTPNLKYKVFALNGNVTSISTFGNTFTATYTYASQQKIRSTFLVVAPSTAGFNFDLIETA
jgi:hypothetical protein